LNVLLHLSGIRNRIVAGLKDDWDTVSKWYPEIRYTQADADPVLPTAEAMISAAERVLEAL
jgi:hypothetical protein